MKKIVLIIGIAFMAWAVNAQQSVTPGKSTNGPVITFTSLIHDFGDRPVNDKNVEHEFEFTNTGNEPLVLSNVQANCGCTSPKWSQTPILPGQKGTISAKYTTTSRAGSFYKQLTVLSNALNGNQILTIKGNISQTVNNAMPGNKAVQDGTVPINETKK